MSIRTFLAIDLNASIREALNDFQSQANSILPVRWIAPESMHVTVKFLGDIQECQVTTLHEALQGVIKEMSPFSLMIKGLGGFPSLQRPRVLWAGVSGEVDHLEVFVSCVESALRASGFAQETRPYHPHLTLSRIKSNSREIGKILEASGLLQQECVFGELVVDRLCLFRSQLGSSGPQYSCLWDLPFRGQIPDNP